MGRTENQLLSATKETLPGDALADGKWNNHQLLEEPIGSMITAKEHVVSDSVLCTGPGALDPLSASTIWEQKVEAITRSDTCKNRSFMG